MHHFLTLLKGLRQPTYYFTKLQDMNTYRGLNVATVIVILLSGFIFGLSALFGTGMSPLSKDLTSLAAADFETEKLLFVGGRVLLGFLYAAFMIYIPALIFWTLAEEGLYRRLVIVQHFVVLVLLLEKVTWIPLFTYLSVSWFSSPFSLGVIAQYITDIPWWIYFLGCISLFKLWVIYLQFQGLKRLIDMKKITMILSILLLNIVLWCVTALLAYIDFTTIL